MKTLLRLSLLLFILFVSASAQAQQNFLDITKYEVYYGWAHNYPQDWIVLRRFQNRDKEYYLLVNPQTLQTKVNESSFYQVQPMTLAQTRLALKIRLMKKLSAKLKNNR